MRTARAWTGAVLGLLISVGMAAAASAPDPVALLVKFDGDVEVERPGADAPLAGEVGLQLQAGDRVVVGQDSRAVVLYRNGTLVRAAAPVVIEEVEEEGSSSLFANTVRTLGQVATTDARTQPNRQGMIRPIAGAPVPVAPRNEIKVLDPRPTFSWLPVPEVERYHLQIQRLGPPAAEPVGYAVGSDTVWTLPASEPPLVPGARYSWTIGGENEGRVAEPKHFVMASSEDIAEIEAALQALVDAGIDPASEGLFLAALAYRDAGLMYEAERAIRQLEDQAAGRGRAFYMLKGEILDAIGDMAGAARAFQKAGAAGP
jgi:hypothetical protein